MYEGRFVFLAPDRPAQASAHLVSGIYEEVGEEQTQKSCSSEGLSQPLSRCPELFWRVA